MPVKGGDYITHDQFQGIVSKEELPKHKLACVLMWRLLTRVSEMLALTPSAIDHPAKLNYGYAPSQHTVNIMRTKTGAFSVLPISDDLHAMLMAYIKDERIKSDQRLIDYTRDNINKRLAATGQKTVNSLKLAHPHAFRRGGGLYLLSKGVKLQELQFMYGHASLSMTLYYLEMQDLDAARSLALTINNL